MPTKKKNTFSKKGKSAGRKPRLSRTVKKAAVKKPVAKVLRAVPPARRQAWHTDIVTPKPATHAHHVHARIHPIALASVGEAGGVSVATSPAAKHGKRGFSFPVALSQVRDHVYTRPQAVKSTHIPSQKKEQPVQPMIAHSPYILDLKHRRTVVHHFQRKPVLTAQTASVERTVKQHGVLSLFDDQAHDHTPLLAKAMGAVAALRSSRSINLLPIQKQPLSRRLRSQAHMFSWQLRSLGDGLRAPFASWRLRRRQGRLELPSLFVAAEPEPLSFTSRSGRPLALSRLSLLFKRPVGLMDTRLSPVDYGRIFARRLNAALGQVKLPSVSWAPACSPRRASREAWRASLSFAALSLVVVGAAALLSAFGEVRQYQMEVLGATNSAIEELKQAQGKAGDMQFMSAAAQFDQAGQAFLVASAVMKNEAPLLAKAAGVLPGARGQVQTASTLLAAGKDLSEAAKLVSQGVSVLSDKDHFLKDQPLSSKLEYFFVRLAEARPFIAASAAALRPLDVSSLPSDVAAQVENLQTTLPEIETQISRMSQMREPLLTFLGHESMQRYLIMFQNNTELRATGGFMGSFALVDIDRGEIKRIEIPGGGPYDVKGSLLDYYQSPRALQLINARWEFQDTNWFLDWPTSAATIARFYEHADGPSVDGVVAVDTHVMEELLRLVGPVSLPQYEVEISADNFRQALQEQVEIYYDRTENKPKKIIGDLAPILLERIKDLPVERSLDLAAVFSELLDERSIQLYHANTDIAQVFASAGWDGRVVDTAGDYLAVVHTNIAGGKTDAVLKDSYDLRVHVAENGEVTNTLTIRRQHTGTKGTPFTGVRSVDYLRVYVPAGSQLVSASGFEQPPTHLFKHPESTWRQDTKLVASEATYTVDPASGTEMYTESGKAVFANWIQVEPGATVEVKLVYRNAAGLRLYDIPAREASWTDWFSGQTAGTPQRVRVYSLYWQKQPGAWSPELAVSVDYPQSWQLQPLEATQPTEVGPGSWRVMETQIRDAWWNFVMY
ncbi:MAG: DUF4012 domain-containing protein [Parcubacteria group bacterium]|nr:DUF4012 domain-containing protein [Parcubacteria group bacterium]